MEDIQFSYSDAVLPSLIVMQLVDIFISHFITVPYSYDLMLFFIIWYTNILGK